MLVQKTIVNKLAHSQHMILMTSMANLILIIFKTAVEFLKGRVWHELLQSKNYN